MLRFDSFIPADVQEGAPVWVLLHGRGSNKEDLQGLAPYLPAGSIVLTPEAPFAGEQWGYGPGWAWYQFQGRNRPEPESFAQSQQALGEFLAAVPSLLSVKPGPIILGGFSQGGVMSMAYALRNPGAIGHVVNFSGFLPDHPSVQPSPESVKGTRFFWGHGTADQMITHALAAEGRGILAGVGADLTAKDYRMGHQISGEEIGDLLAWLQGR
ncbi:MAG TPA: alpha/beta fold hydrolase [Symbiobacteriaceae bacterium]|nr:alpha/beta fold hydrolase [Symbiobacteriaceae bacterium]